MNCGFWCALKIQQVANGILMATAAAIGLLCYFLGETKQRRAFLEAKQSLEVKMVIEEQSAEQVKRKIYVNFFFENWKNQHQPIWTFAKCEK